MLANGFIIAFVQTSNTSPKKARIASSVCGLVGLFGIDVLADEEDRPVVVDGGLEVYGVKGGKDVGVGFD